MSSSGMSEREPINLIELLGDAFTEFRGQKPTQKQITDYVVNAFQFDYETAKNIAEGLLILWTLYKGHSGDQNLRPHCKKLMPRGTQVCGKPFVHSETKNDATGEYVVLICMGKHVTKLRMK